MFWGEKSQPGVAGHTWFALDRCHRIAFHVKKQPKYLQRSGKTPSLSSRGRKAPVPGTPPPPSPPPLHCVCPSRAYLLCGQAAGRCLFIGYVSQPWNTNTALNLLKTEHLLLRVCPRVGGDWIYFLFPLTFTISEDDVRLYIIQHSK